MLDRLAEIGVLSPDGRGYGPEDVRIIDAIARFREGGYDERLGFTVYDTLRYVSALEPLVAEEVSVLLERLAGEERAVDIVAAGDRAAARPDRRDPLQAPPGRVPVAALTDGQRIWPNRVDLQLGRSCPTLRCGRIRRGALAVSYDSRWTGRLSIRHDSVMGIQVLAFDGVLDAGTLPAAHESAQAAIDRGAPLVLDLHALRDVLGDAGAQLWAMLRELRAAGLAVAVVRSPAPAVTQVVDAARADGEVPVADGLSAAIEAVSPRWSPDGPRWTPDRAVQVRRD